MNYVQILLLAQIYLVVWALEKMTEHSLMMLRLNSWLFWLFILEGDLLGLPWNLAV